MTKYIYSRVSTTEQNSQQQAEMLNAKYKADVVVEEKASGKDMERPVLVDRLGKLKAGDTLIVYSVCRIGRNAVEVLGIAEDLKNRGVHLIINALGETDLCSPMGKMILTVFAGMAEMERETMLERQRIGIERAKAEGKYKGRKPTDEAMIETAKQLRANGMKTPDIAKQLKIGQSTLYRLLQASSEA